MKKAWDVSKSVAESQILIDEMNALRNTRKPLTDFASNKEFFAYTKEMAKKKAEILSKIQNIYQ
jgi:hypothetical protein